MRVTKKQARKVGKKIGILFSRGAGTKRRPSLEQFRQGMSVEYEHGLSGGRQTNVTDDDPVLTGKIALAHLRERPDYYKMLKKYVESRHNPSRPSIQFHRKPQTEISVRRLGNWAITTATLFGKHFVCLRHGGKLVAQSSHRTKEAAARRVLSLQKALKNAR